jgi:hypothetical protein
MRWASLVSILCAVLLTGATAWGQDEPSAAFEPDLVFPGLSGAIWLTDFSALNALLDDAGYAPLPRTVPMYGQTSVVGLRDGPRLGFRVLYGSAKSRAGERVTELAATLGAGLIEWGILRGPTASIALGLSLGAGTVVLTLVDHRPETFDDALTAPFRAKLDRWLYTIEPSISAHGAPFEWLDMRLQLGYLLAFGRTWKAEGAEFGDAATALGGPTVEASFAIHLERLRAPSSQENDETQE